jgi:hypothetical protein
VDVDWGDGTAHTTYTVAAAGSLGTKPHTYDDNGAYTVTITVADKNAGVGTASFHVTVANTAPTPTITGAPATSPEGTAISVTVAATDPSGADTAAGITFAWTVTRDGSPFTTGTGAALTFTPDDNGSSVIAVTATDKDGGIG